jgi:hypothetical protein
MILYKAKWAKEKMSKNEYGSNQIGRESRPE